MALPTITQDFGEIVGRGGNLIYLIECDDDGSDLTSPDTFHNMGNVLNSTPIATLGRDDITLEDGTRIRTHGDEEIGVTFQLAQDVDIEAIAREVAGKFYHLFWKKGIYNGLTRERVGFGQVFIDSGGNQKPGAPGGPTLAFMYLKAPQAITFDTTGTGDTNILLPTDAVATSLVLAAGTYYKEGDN